MIIKETNTKILFKYKEWDSKRYYITTYVISQDKKSLIDVYFSHNIKDAKEFKNTYGISMFKVKQEIMKGTIKNGKN